MFALAIVGIVYLDNYATNVNNSIVYEICQNPRYVLILYKNPFDFHGCI